jgi:hypothetical protein
LTAGHIETNPDEVRLRLDRVLIQLPEPVATLAAPSSPTARPRPSEPWGPSPWPFPRPAQARRAAVPAFGETSRSVGAPALGTGARRLAGRARNRCRHARKSGYQYPHLRSKKRQTSMTIAAWMVDQIINSDVDIPPNSHTNIGPNVAITTAIVVIRKGKRMRRRGDCSNLTPVVIFGS